MRYWLYLKCAAAVILISGLLLSLASLVIWACFVPSLPGSLPFFPSSAGETDAALGQSRKEYETMVAAFPDELRLRFMNSAPQHADIHSPGDEFSVAVHTDISAICGKTSLPVIGGIGVMDDLKAEITTGVTNESPGFTVKVKRTGCTGLPVTGRIQTRGMFGTTAEIVIECTCRIADDASLVGTTVSATVHGSGRTTGIGGAGDYYVRSFSINKSLEAFVWPKETRAVAALRDRVLRLERQSLALASALPQPFVHRTESSDWKALSVTGLCILALAARVVLSLIPPAVRPFAPEKADRFHNKWKMDWKT